MEPRSPAMQFALTHGSRRRSRFAIVAAAAVVALAIYAQAAPLFNVGRVRDSYSYYFAAAALQRGADPYDPGVLNELAPDRIGPVGPYLYPPVFALAWSPILVLKPEAAHGALVTVSTLLVLVNAALLWSVLPRLPNPRGWLLAFLGLHAISGPVVASVRLGQVNALLGTLIFGALALEKARHSRLAGVVLSLAFLTKVTPVLYAYDLVVRRRVATFVSFAGCTALLIALSVAMIGPAPWWGFLEVLHRPKPFEPIMSIHGLLVHTIGRNPNLAGAVEIVWVVASLALLIVVAVRLLRPGGESGDPVRNWSVITLLALLVSPMTWHHHYYIALLPFSYLVLRAQGPRLRAVAVAVALLALLRYPGPLHFLKPLCALAGIALLGITPHVGEAKRAGRAAPAEATTGIA